ncbi:hypothetical protein ES703_93348 [subsurface metagenome]
MDSSDTAGTPCGNLAVKAQSLVPGDSSVTIPVISALPPCVITLFWIEAVVALGPLPIAYTRWSYVSIVAIMLSPIMTFDPQ